MQTITTFYHGMKPCDEITGDFGNGIERLRVVSVHDASTIQVERVKPWWQRLLAWLTSAMRRG